MQARYLIGPASSQNHCQNFAELLPEFLALLAFLHFTIIIHNLDENLHFETTVVPWAAIPGK